MKKLNKKGFTLLELLAVLVILAALATIAIPIFTNKGADARLQAHKENIRLITDAAQRYEWDNGAPALNTTTYYTKLSTNHELIKKGYLTSVPVNPYKSVTTTNIPLSAKYEYAIGKSLTTSTNTEAKLVAAGTQAAPTDINLPADIVDGTTGKWVATIPEIPTATATAGTDPTSVTVS